MKWNNQLVQDIGILVARLGIGTIMLAYGWQKLIDWTIPGTAEVMAGGGVPLPTLSAYFTTFAELLAGTALIVGAAVPLAGLVSAFIMAGAFVFVHAGNGIYVDSDGYGFVLAVGVTSLMLAATGSGRFGADHVVAGRFLKRRAEPLHAG